MNAWARLPSGLPRAEIEGRIENDSQGRRKKRPFWEFCAGAENGPQPCLEWQKGNERYI